MRISSRTVKDIIFKNYIRLSTQFTYTANFFCLLFEILKQFVV